MSDQSAAAAALRVMVDGSAADDRRVTMPRSLNDTFTFPHYATLAEWEQEASNIREHILACTGLLPMPDKCPLNPRIFGRLQRDGYTVEKVLLETWPGFFLGGNLYRPLGKKGPFPAIINPHGHWSRGRIHHDPELGSLPGRFINFARQGYVAFAYDMIGYNDTFQLPHDFGGERETLWGMSLLGLQLWNSIRAVDFVASLPEVDAGRIGCTGASGGGSQTFLVTAVEPRIAAALPCVMVSAHMQGGCLCENAPSLRLRYSNVQIAACAAPRPLHLIACTRDWTKDTATVEYPAIRSIYELYGAGDKVSCFIQDAEHNYNFQSRKSCYEFFGKYLLGETDPDRLAETPFQVEADDDLLALPDKRLPQGALNRASLVRQFVGRAQRDLAHAAVRDAGSLKRYRKTFGSVLRHTMDIAVPPRQELAVISLGTVAGDGYVAERLLLGRTAQGDNVPALLFTPSGKRVGRKGVVVVHEYGKAALMEPGLTAPGKLIRGLLAAGRPVLAVDAFLTGEFIAQAGLGARRERGVHHFHTYNRPDVVERAQDILTALATVTVRTGTARPDLAGLGEAGLWCLLAAAAAEGKVGRLAADLAGFDRSCDAEFIERLNVPHVRRAGDLVTAVALHAPRPLLLSNVGDGFDPAPMRAAYRAAGKPTALQVRRGPVSESAVLRWLLDTD